MKAVLEKWIGGNFQDMLERKNGNYLEIFHSSSERWVEPELVHLVEMEYREEYKTLGRMSFLALSLCFYS